MEASPGQRYVLETVVATTATYGDTFRPVVRHSLAAAGPGSARLQVSVALVFVAKVNGLVKGMIEKGEGEGGGGGGGGAASARGCGLRGALGHGIVDAW